MTLSTGEFRSHSSRNLSRFTDTLLLPSLAEAELPAGQLVGIENGNKPEVVGVHAISLSAGLLLSSSLAECRPITDGEYRKLADRLMHTLHFSAIKGVDPAFVKAILDGSGFDKAFLLQDTQNTHLFLRNLKIRKTSKSSSCSSLSNH